MTIAIDLSTYCAKYSVSNNLACLAVVTRLRSSNLMREITRAMFEVAMPGKNGTFPLVLVTNRNKLHLHRSLIVPINAVDVQIITEVDQTRSCTYYLTHLKILELNPFFTLSPEQKVLLSNLAFTD